MITALANVQQRAVLKRGIKYIPPFITQVQMLQGKCRGWGILLTVTHPDFKQNESQYTQIQVLTPRGFDLVFQRVQKEGNTFREAEFCRRVFSF